MDNKVSVKKPQSSRRPATRSSMKGTAADLAPRAPLKRTSGALRTGGTEDQIPATDVNGSKDEDSEPEDGEPTKKKSKVLPDGATDDDSNDEGEMEVQEEDDNSENTEDQEMTPTEDPCTTVLQSAHVIAPLPKSTPALNMNPCVMLHRRPPIRTEDLGATGRPRTNRENKSTNVQYRENMAKSPSSSWRTMEQSMAQYREKMEAKATSNDIPRVYHDIKRPTTSEASYATRPCVNNNIPSKRKPEKSLQKSQGGKKSAIKGSAESPSRGYTWWLVLLLLLLGSAALLTYKKFPAFYQNADDGEHTSRSVSLEEFASGFSALEAQFPSQRADLWKRSRIHLSKHLQMEQPTEPVSLILTAGRKAEKTLHCLAGGLASAFSSALNASVLHIDGASKARQDSGQVKLDIDNQLREAFEGDKPVAVIHRFEELPPGSTLIFYRYCDHETAAYKQVFLAFTVLLPQEEVPEQKSLKDVEEMVHDYINQRFVGTDGQTGFDEMDVNKLSGLWSRISHLILPVEAEDEVEQKGCQ